MTNTDQSRAPGGLTASSNASVDSVDPFKYKHGDLLNRLSEMAQAPYYATACHTLVKAEMAIVDLERENAGLRAEVSRLATGRGWLPIESAPKDGTPVLVSNADRGDSWIAMFKPVSDSGFRPDNPWFSLMLNCRWHPNQMGSFHPTHWMHLPPAPIGGA